MLIANWHVPWKIASHEENLILQVLQFQKIGVCHKFLFGAGIPNGYFVEG
jgi:hypothetical protein